MISQFQIRKLYRKQLDRPISWVEIRIALDISERELARRVKLSQATVNDILHDRIMPGRLAQLSMRVYLETLLRSSPEAK